MLQEHIQIEKALSHPNSSIFGTHARNSSSPSDRSDPPGPVWIKDENGKSHLLGVHSLLSMILEAEKQAKSTLPAVSHPLDIRTSALSLSESNRTELETANGFLNPAVEEETAPLLFTFDEAVKFCKCELLREIKIDPVKPY